MRRAVKRRRSEPGKGEQEISKWQEKRRRRRARLDIPAEITRERRMGRYEAGEIFHCGLWVVFFLVVAWVALLSTCGCAGSEHVPLGGQETTGAPIEAGDHADIDSETRSGESTAEADSAGGDVEQTTFRFGLDEGMTTLLSGVFDRAMEVVGAPLRSGGLIAAGTVATIALVVVCGGVLLLFSNAPDDGTIPLIGMKLKPAACAAAIAMAFLGLFLIWTPIILAVS